VIRTSDEHPFWVRGKGWTEAVALEVGDELSSHDGRWLAVEAVERGEVYQRLYNMRVADYHTYFVGCPEWGFSVWAHNLGGCDVWAALGGKAEEFASLPQKTRDALNAVATSVESRAGVSKVRDLLRQVPGSSLTPREASGIARTLRPTTPAPAAASGTTGGNPRVFRVQGGESQRRFVVEGKKLKIEGTDRVHVNVNQEGHAQYWVRKRGGAGEAVELVEFEVKPEFVKKLRETAVDMRVGRQASRGKPQIVDRRTPDQFSIPQDMFDELLGSIVPDTVKVTTYPAK
jgi:hypothetical protein